MVENVPSKLHDDEASFGVTVSAFAPPDVYAVKRCVGG